MCIGSGEVGWACRHSTSNEVMLSKSALVSDGTYKSHFSSFLFSSDWSESFRDHRITDLNLEMEKKSMAFNFFEVTLNLNPRF